MDVIGLLASVGALPLVEPVGRDQTPTLAEGPTERGLLRGSLGAGVDHARTYLRVVGPRGDEAPPEHLQSSLPALRQDRRNPLRGGDVVVWRKIDRRTVEAELFRQPLHRGRERVPAAHISPSSELRNLSDELYPASGFLPSANLPRQTANACSVLSREALHGPRRWTHRSCAHGKARRTPPSKKEGRASWPSRIWLRPVPGHHLCAAGCVRRIGAPGPRSSTRRSSPLARGQVRSGAGDRQRSGSYCPRPPKTPLSARPRSAASASCYGSCCCGTGLC